MLTAAQLAVKVTAQGVSETKEGLRGVGSAAEHARGLFSNLASGVFHMGGNLLELGAKLGMTVFGLKNLASAAEGMATALFSSNATLEQQTIAFTGLLHSGTKAKAFLDDLQQFAAATPFEFPDLVDASQKMLAFGFSAQQVKPMLTAVGDAAAGLGAGKDAVNSMIYALGQMHAAGVVHTQDLMQLANVGIPVYQLLADGLGTTTAQMKAMVEKGAVPADKAIDILQKGLEKTFGGQMANQATTFNGLLSTLHDNIRMALTAFMGPLFERAKGALEKLGALVSGPEFQAFAKTVGEKIGTAVGKLADFIEKHLQPALQHMQPTMHEVAAFVQQQVVPAFQEMATWAQEHLIPAIEQLATWFQTKLMPRLADLATFIREHVLPVLNDLRTWFLEKVLPAAEKLAEWFMEHVVPVLEKLWIVIQQDVIPTVEDIANHITQKFIPAIERLWNKLSPILVPALQLVGWTLKNVVGPAISWIIDRIADFVNSISDAIDTVGNFLGTLGKVKDAVGNGLGFIGSHLPHFASGGITPGGPFLGAENGPELLIKPGVYTAPAGSRILNASDTARVLTSGGGRASGGNTYHYHYTINGADANQVVSLINRANLLDRMAGRI